MFKNIVCIFCFIFILAGIYYFYLNDSKNCFFNFLKKEHDEGIANLIYNSCAKVNYKKTESKKLNKKLFQESRMHQCFLDNINKTQDSYVAGLILVACEEQFPIDQSLKNLNPLVELGYVEGKAK